ncbi:MAG: phosphoglycerate dehydrogenase [Coriobacteriia bacterium]|nr:phosphoglycerate dehydrogenase [Coriobacteriia bacterium]
MKKVLVAEKISDKGLDLLRDKFEVHVKLDLTPEELVVTIPGYEALIVRSATRATREVIEAGKSLEIIGRAGVGVDNVDVAAATEQGVIVCNAPTSNIVSAAEQAIALMYACARRTAQADRSMKEGKWERSALTGTELYDKTLAIFGLGRIGTLVAERARAMGMKLIGYDPYASEAKADSLGVTLMSDIDAILELADVITVHLPKTKETIGMFDEARFAKMRDGVILVNAARGGIFEENALIAALESSKVASVGIDVYEHEPCTDSPLRAFDNAILTPHLGASTSEAQERAGVQIAEYVMLGLEGRMVPTAVNVTPVPADVMDKVRPFIDLVQDMGQMLSQFATGGIEAVEVVTVGRLAALDTTILTTAALKGILSKVTADPVNFVNANYIAEQRGIEVTETKRKKAYAYSSLIILKAQTPHGEVRMAGTVIGKNKEPRLVSLFGADLDVRPSQHMAFFQYPDQPGVIGRIGMALGAAGVNIGMMQVARTEVGGDALMALTVDSPLSAATLTELTRSCDATVPMKNAWYIQL